MMVICVWMLIVLLKISSAVLQGTVVKDPKSPVDLYYINAKLEKQLIPDMDTWNSLNIGDKVTEIDSKTFDLIPVGQKLRPINSPVSKEEFEKNIGMDKYIYKQEDLGPLLKLHNKSTSKMGESGISFHCNFLFENLLSKKDDPPVHPGPREPPNHMRNAYSLSGQIKQETWYFDSSAEFHNQGNEVKTWTEQWIYSWSDRCHCTYKGSHCQDTVDKYGDYVKGKHGLIVGSETPWAEAAFIGRGAEITTIEYNKIVSLHPKLHTMTPFEAAADYLENKFPLADFIFTFSSLEHDGLGRYGDPLNPNGDLESMARLHCLLKPNGTLFLGLPVGDDCVVWNAHRVYGNVRLSLIFSFWEFVDVIGAFHVPGDNGCKCDHQPVMVLRKHHLHPHS